MIKKQSKISNSLISGVIFLAIDYLEGMGFDVPNRIEVSKTLGSSRNQAYEMRNRLEKSLESNSPKVGRPKRTEKKPEPPGPEITRKVLEYIYAHPGCVAKRGSHTKYSEDFRLFLLEFFERNEFTLETISSASNVPFGTLKQWVHKGQKSSKKREQVKSSLEKWGAWIGTILEEWSRWSGNFSSFHKHIKDNCFLPIGKGTLGNILAATGVRNKKLRSGRSADEIALRDSFNTFFPHAQWVGDGAQIPIMVNGKLFVFNLELNVDAFSAALVGAHISSTENSNAVIKAFEDSVLSTGIKPLTLLLDNKPSNHCKEVKEELGNTTVIPSTKGRGQSKAHVEGAFGTLKPSLDGMVLEGSTPEELAATYLKNLIIVYSRALNHRPRKTRKGKSRVELLEDSPTTEQIDKARAYFEHLKKNRKRRF